nr:MAG TPA: hypothetical protein [Caudoviricetes sp.]
MGTLIRKSLINIMIRDFRISSSLKMIKLQQGLNLMFLIH